jgi:hypothetical protein
VKSIERDCDTVRHRTTFEGLSFLTKTLPKLGKALDQGLENSRFSCPKEFRLLKGCSIPAFMQGYFNRVFDSAGYLLDDADPVAVSHIRQVCFLVYKLEVPYSLEQESRVIETFVENEEYLRSFSMPDDEVLRLSSRITSTVFEGFDPMDITPRHGPGAVSTGERLEDKWVFSRKYSGIHAVYPYYDYFVVGGAREILDRLDWYKSLRPTPRGIAKVVLVPKDSRGPRLISCEPLEYQWIQQGLGRKLSHHLERISPLTRWRVNFTNQEINRDHALQSSLTGEYATIDLKDASDLVSLKLVRAIFRNEEKLLRCLEACRTSATLLPDGRVLDLEKYAPMGSALCFPVEAYCFWVLCVSEVVSTRGLPLKSVARSIYVYGDDIVVPSDWVDQCIQCLERYGLRVNRSKCCIKGSFRESCGMDAFKGVCVTPIRLKTLWTGRSVDGSALESYTSFMNLIRERGYDSVSDHVRQLVEGVFGVLPLGTPFASYPCVKDSSPERVVEVNSRHFKRRWNRRYQRVEFRVLRTLPRKRDSVLDDWPRLLREQVLPGNLEPSRVVVPRSTIIKRDWVAVY